MTVDAYAWLPTNSFGLERVREAFGDVLRDWAAAWLVDTPAAVSRVEDGEVVHRISDDSEIRASSAAVQLVMGGRGKRNLIEAALRIELAGTAPTDADHRLLALFSKRLADDLADRLSDFAGIDATGDDARMTLTLAINGKDSMSVSLPRSAIARLLKARVLRTDDGRRPTSRRSALASTRVDVEGVLGQVSLSVEDLKGISVGDVLVLDRLTTAPVDLRVSESGRHLRSGRLQTDRGHVAVQF